MNEWKSSYDGCTFGGDVYKWHFKNNVERIKMEITHTQHSVLELLVESIYAIFFEQKKIQSNLFSTAEADNRA